MTLTRRAFLASSAAVAAVAAPVLPVLTSVSQPLRGPQLTFTRASTALGWDKHGNRGWVPENVPRSGPINQEGELALLYDFRT